jgi:hypothetical protein
MPQNNRQPIGVGVSALCWAAILGLLATLVWLASFDALNADELYALALIGDVWTNVPFRWMLQPANGLFPGLIIAGVGFTAGLDGIGFYVFFAAAFSIVLFIGIIYFFRQAGLNTAHIWPGAAVGVMLICFASTQSLRLLLFCPACHAGVVAAALLAFALALEHVKRGKLSTLWLFALVMLSTFSTCLQFPNWCCPLSSA